LLSPCGILPPTCLLVTVNEARRYFASSMHVVVTIGVERVKDCSYACLVGIQQVVRTLPLTALLFQRKGQLVVQAPQVGAVPLPRVKRRTCKLFVQVPEGQATVLP
jgi:hypothetical protein